MQRNATFIEQQSRPANLIPPIPSNGNRIMELVQGLVEEQEAMLDVIEKVWTGERDAYTKVFELLKQYGRVSV